MWKHTNSIGMKVGQFFSICSSFTIDRIGSGWSNFLTLCQISWFLSCMYFPENRSNQTRLMDSISVVGSITSLTSAERQTHAHSRN